MASVREQVLEAVKALVAAALPSADVERNRAKPRGVGAGGTVIVRDGEPGEPDIDLSPLTYNYSHRIVLEFAVYETGALTLDQMLVAVGAAVAADRTLGGLCQFLEAEAPSTDDLEQAGAAAGRWAEVAIIASYGTPNPI